MKIVDILVLAVFIVALVVLGFMQQCSLDIYFLVLGYGVAIMAVVAMFMQRRKTNN